LASLRWGAVGAAVGLVVGFLGAVALGR
jgi:hypothetical protein